MNIIRILIAIVFVGFGLIHFPYPKEDRHKIGLAFGCAAFVAAGVLSLVLSSWWPLPIGLVLGFGFPLLHLVINPATAGAEDEVGE